MVVSNFAGGVKVSDIQIQEFMQDLIKTDGTYAATGDTVVHYLGKRQEVYRNGMTFGDLFHVCTSDGYCKAFFPHNESIWFNREKMILEQGEQVRKYL